MTKIYFGCNEIPRHWDQYFSQCNAVELDLEELDNPPRTDTLNRWRVESPRGFAFVLHVQTGVTKGLVAAAQAGRGEITDAIKSAWEVTLEQAHALAARALVIQTPPSFTPGKIERALIEDLASQLGSDFSKPIIWEARGMWETETTRPWATELGLVYAYDPFLAMRDEISFEHGDGAFIINERAGMRREFDRYDIRGFLDGLGSYNRVFVLLRGRFKWAHARHFQEQLADAT